MTTRISTGQLAAPRVRPPAPGAASRAGFTLIEFSVAIALVGILAQSTYPGHARYVIRANRSAAQQAMLEIANRKGRFLLSSRIYGSLSQLNVSLPDQVTKFYSIR